MGVVFEYLFEKSNFFPIEYKGKRVSLFDDIVIPPGRVELIIRFERVESDWEQGIFLKGQGEFFINNQKLKDSIYLWKTTAPDIVAFTFDSKDGNLKIWNVWRINDGPMQYGHNGAALYYEEINNGRRYFCNDGYPDDDFNDLIFSIEINGNSKKV